MRRVSTEGELADLMRVGVGVIYNDFAPGTRPGRPPSRSAQRGNVLHAASCPRLQVSLTVAKYHADDLPVAIEWLASHRGAEGPAWHRDGCLGAASPVADDAIQPAADAQSKRPPPDGPGIAREREVEARVIDWLSRRGFAVQTRVRVASGIIDLVAVRDDERLVVEVKGEDAGGYTSAQMNFLISIGQIASRMTEDEPIYALAFPLTPDYRRVLRTFRGSRAFERLRIDLLVLDPDPGADIQRLAPHEIRAWMQEL